MKINMDEEMHAYQLRKSQTSSHALGEWLVIIAIGVFIGNMFAWGSQRAIDNWIVQQELKKFNEQMETQNKINNARLEQQRKLNAVQSKQRTIELQNKQAGYRQASETCNFWNQQVRIENTTQNRLYRDQACNLLSKFR